MLNPEKMFTNNEKMSSMSDSSSGNLTGGFTSGAASLSVPGASNAQAVISGAASAISDSCQMMRDNMNGYSADVQARHTAQKAERPEDFSPKRRDLRTTRAKGDPYEEQYEFYSRLFVVKV